MPFQSRPANSLAEYALPLAVVGVVVCSMMSSGLLNENLQIATQLTNNGTLSDTRLDIDRVGNMDKSLIQKGEDLKQYYLIEGISFVEGNTACFGDAGCLEFPNIAGGPVTEVDGTLGGRTVSQYSKLLLKLAKNLKERGAPDRLVSLVESLGKSGMKIGNNILNIPRGTIECYPDCADYNVPGRGYGQYYFNKAAASTEFQQLKAKLDQYLQANPAVAESFASAAPIVNGASTNILQAAQGSLTGPIMPGTTLNTSVTYVASGKLVKMNATTICQTVNGNQTCPVISK